MNKTYNINHSLSYLRSGKKIYKRTALYDIARLLLKAIHYNLININILQEQIKEIEQKRFEENEKYLDKELEKEK